MRITRMERQKKRAPLYHLYSGDVFLFEITEDTLVHFNISVGRDYSDQQLQEIQDYDRFTRCTHQAFRFLSRRAHLERELRQKLRRKQYGEPEISRTMEFLRLKGYLDDRAVISKFIHDEINLKRTGPLRIKAKLLQKGAARETVEEILEREYPEQVILNNAQTLAERKMQGTAPISTQKLAAFLQNKGFPWEIIERTLAGL